MSGAAVLCYVEGHMAWFTTAPLQDQWGDDWDDAPYEHNAGSPYSWRDYMGERGTARYELVRVFWTAPWLIEPREYHTNSPWSVEQINAGAVAWLRTEKWAEKQAAIRAGATLDEFRRFIWDLGGEVYERTPPR